MAHSANIISSIKLPNGTTYEIHDAQAIHKIEDLGLASVLKFKGTQASESAVHALTSAEVGDVYLAGGAEYVCIEAISGTAKASAWEKLGNVHDAAASNHTHTTTVTGTNAASTVTGTVTVPTVSKTQKYLSAAAGVPTVTPVTDTVLGTGTTFAVSGGAANATKTKIGATASGAAVGANGTAKAITALGTPTTAAAITALNTTTVKNPTVTPVSIPNVTGNSAVTATKMSSYGTLPSWSASVSDGVLSFSFGAGTLPTGSDVSASKVTLGTALSASSVSTSDVTVATGSKSTANAITGFGTHTTANALTGVKMTAQPTITLSADATTGVDVVIDVSNSAISVTASGDNVTAMTGVTVGAPAITLTNNSSSVTGSVPVVSAVEIGSASASLTNGSAAAQKWTQASGTTSTPK